MNHMHKYNTSKSVFMIYKTVNNALSKVLPIKFARSAVMRVSKIKYLRHNHNKSTTGR